MRILIVEDDAMIGASLVRGLTDEGYAVDWVRDGGYLAIIVLMALESSATRAERLADLTELNVATASTSVPAPVASDEAATVKPAQTLAQAEKNKPQR